MAKVTSVALAFALTAPLSADESTRTPITLHPDNPHYFLFRDKPTVLVTSGEHYGAVLNLDFDYRIYLDELARHGFNLTRTFSGIYVEHWGEGWNTLNPARERYVAPWARGASPGYADGGNRFDLERWDDAYFRRLKDFVAEASRRGIVVELVLFCVFYDDQNWALCPLNARNNQNGVGSKDRKTFFDVSDAVMMGVQERMTTKLVSELREFDNVYFELCNEPYFEGPKLGSPWNDRIIRAIRAANSDHLIALNVANGSVKVDRMHAGVSILNFHYCSPPDAVGLNRHHRAVVAFDETGFRGPAADHYRKEAWEFLLAGGAVYSNLDWSFTADSEQGQSKAAQDRLGPKDPALRTQLAYLKRFVESFDFIRMKPDSSVIRGGIPSGAKVRALVEPGRQYAIFLDGGAGTALQLELPAGDYTIEWHDPKRGRVLRTAKLVHKKGSAELRSPDGMPEVAVTIRKPK